MNTSTIANNPESIKRVGQLIQFTIYLKKGIESYSRQYLGAPVELLEEFSLQHGSPQDFLSWKQRMATEAERDRSFDQIMADNTLPNLTYGTTQEDIQELEEIITELMSIHNSKPSSNVKTSGNAMKAKFNRGFDQAKKRFKTKLTESMREPIYEKYIMDSANVSYKINIQDLIKKEVIAHNRRSNLA